MAARLTSLDITRGLIVALMALDHVRIFFAEAQFDPVDLSQTTSAYFFTRLVTHLCAPGFFFIAGFGAALSELSGLPKSKLATFLVTRGLWLIALDLTVMGVAWSFGFSGWFWFGVLWGLGAAMLAMAVLIFVPKLALLVVAALAIAFQDQWLALVSAQGGSFWALLATGGVWGAPLVGPKIVLYPLLPWLCLMVLGYALTPHLMRDGAPRPQRLMALGIAMLGAFAACRLLGFGGGSPESGDRALLAFLNVEKYPPSLQFSLLTLGVLLAVFGLLAHAERNGAKLSFLHPLEMFGRTPFFFYVIHVFLIHGAALACAYAFGWPTDYLFWSGIGPNLTPPDGYGFGVPGIYVTCLAILALLYPACAWFAGVKAKSNAWWLRYL
jgi:uncharacterized membrane protein